MSKQSEAKKRQGYNPKPLAKSCRTCGNLDIRQLPLKWTDKVFGESLFCGIGDFAVKAQATCNEWKEIEAP